VIVERPCSELALERFQALLEFSIVGEGLDFSADCVLRIADRGSWTTTR